MRRRDREHTRQSETRQINAAWIVGVAGVHLLARVFAAGATHNLISEEGAGDERPVESASMDLDPYREGMACD